MATYNVHVQDDVYMRYSVGDDNVITIEAMFQHTHTWTLDVHLQARSGGTHFLKLYTCECGGIKEVAGRIGSAMPEVTITEPGAEYAPNVPE